MKKISKKYKNIPELFGQNVLTKYPNLEKFKTDSYSGTDIWGENYSQDVLTYYKCFCGKGRILEHYNYEEGMGSDTWVYCDCEKCIKTLKNDNLN